MILHLQIFVYIVVFFKTIFLIKKYLLDVTAFVFSQIHSTIARALYLYRE